MMDFIYERFRLPSGVKIEEVTGGEHYKGKVWTEIARQIYCENGKDGYRELGHFPSGAPFIFGAEERISISHTPGMLVVATIPVSPETNLSLFSPSSALGVDVEKEDREKVLSVRNRFLTQKELDIIPSDSLRDNVIAWTCKEAILKAGMKSDIDWLNDIGITSLPDVDRQGSGFIMLDGKRYEFNLTTMVREGFIITVAVSNKG